MSKPDPKRLRQFKLLAAFLFLIPVVVLIVLVNHLLELGSAKALEYNQSINQRNAEFAKGNDPKENIMLIKNQPVKIPLTHLPFGIAKQRKAELAERFQSRIRMTERTNPSINSSKPR